MKSEAFWQFADGSVALFRKGSVVMRNCEKDVGKVLPIIFYEHGTKRNAFLDLSSFRLYTIRDDCETELVGEIREKPESKLEAVFCLKEDVTACVLVTNTTDYLVAGREHTLTKVIKSTDYVSYYLALFKLGEKVGAVLYERSNVFLVYEVRGDEVRRVGKTELDTWKNNASYGVFSNPLGPFYVVEKVPLSRTGAPPLEAYRVTAYTFTGKQNLERSFELIVEKVVPGFLSLFLYSVQRSHYVYPTEHGLRELEISGYKNRELGKVLSSMNYDFLHDEAITSIRAFTLTGVGRGRKRNVPVILDCALL